MQIRKLSVVAVALALSAGPVLAQSSSQVVCAVTGVLSPTQGALQQELVKARAAREAFLTTARAQEATLASAVSKAETARAQAMTKYTPLQATALRTAAQLENAQALASPNTAAGFTDLYAARKAQLARDNQDAATQAATALADARNTQSALASKVAEYDLAIARGNVDIAYLQDQMTYALFNEAFKAPAESPSATPFATLANFTMNPSPALANQVEDAKTQVAALAADRAKAAAALERQQRDVARLQALYAERQAELQLRSSTLSLYSTLTAARSAALGLTLQLTATRVQLTEAARGVMTAVETTYKAQQQLRAMQQERLERLAGYDASINSLMARLGVCAR